MAEKDEEAIVKEAEASLAIAQLTQQVRVRVRGEAPWARTRRSTTPTRNDKHHLVPSTSQWDKMTLLRFFGWSTSQSMARLNSVPRFSFKFIILTRTWTWFPHMELGDIVPDKTEPEGNLDAEVLLEKLPLILPDVTLTCLPKISRTSHVHTCLGGLRIPHHPRKDNFLSLTNRIY